MNPQPSADYDAGSATAHNERAEGGAAAASATSAAAKRVPDHQRPPSALDTSPLSARDKLDLELMARQGRTLGQKPWAAPEHEHEWAERGGGPGDRWQACWTCGQTRDLPPGGGREQVARNA